MRLGCACARSPENSVMRRRDVLRRRPWRCCSKKRSPRTSAQRSSIVIRRATVPDSGLHWWMLWSSSAEVSWPIPKHFDAALAALATAGQARRLLVVPGGGPFADSVRAVDRQHRLSDDAAHWMAILAMDQYAHLIASRLACAQLVSTKEEILTAERGE